MKKLSIILLGIALTGLLAVIGVYVALMMFLRGTWPFPALETKTAFQHLSNGGQVKVVSIEVRGFGSDGFSCLYIIWQVLKSSYTYDCVFRKMDRA